MEYVQLIHWNASEAKERAARIEALGYQVAYKIPAVPDFLRKLGNNPPAAVIIDLSRLPSQGRDLALLIRKRKTTRYVPLVFIGGAPEKAARIKELLPDACFAAWEDAGRSLKEAILNPPADPAVPSSQFAAYADRSLTEKLGIKAGSVVGLADAPDDFIGTLGELPKEAQLRERPDNECNMFIWFVRSRKQLENGVKRMAVLAVHGPLWIVWPKQASRMRADITQQQVREIGLAAGLVDYKVCSIDKTWAGLLFTRKKTN